MNNLKTLALAAALTAAATASAHTPRPYRADPHAGLDQTAAAAAEAIKAELRLDLKAEARAALLAQRLPDPALRLAALGARD